MHIVFLPTKEDVRMPEADPKFRGETWQTATEAQARAGLTRLPHAPALLVLKLCILLESTRQQATKGWLAASHNSGFAVTHIGLR